MEISFIEMSSSKNGSVSCNIFFQSELTLELYNCSARGFPSSWRRVRSAKWRGVIADVFSHRFDKDLFVGHLRRLLHVEPVRFKGTSTRRKGEVDQVRAQYHVIPEKRMAEPGQEPINKATIDGQQQPVHNGAGGLVTSGVLPAGVVSAPGVTRDSRGKFVAGGAMQKLKLCVDMAQENPHNLDLGMPLLCAEGHVAPEVAAAMAAMPKVTRGLVNFELKPPGLALFEHMVQYAVPVAGGAPDFTNTP